MMGLDLSHGAGSMTYSSFNELRNAIAIAAGYGLRQIHIDMVGHTKAFIVPDIEELLPDGPHRFNQGEWPALPEDPLLVLLAHSDCDGEIPAEFCTPLAKALEDLLPKIKDGRGGVFPEYGHRQRTQRLINGLREAAKAGEALVFR